MSPQQVAEFVVVVHVVTLICVFSAAPAAIMAGDCAVMSAAKHLTINRTNAGMRETCMTVDPVAACPEGCVSIAKESQLKAMHCLPVSSKDKSQMLQTVQWKHIDDYETVQVPTACKLKKP